MNLTKIYTVFMTKENIKEEVPELKYKLNFLQIESQQGRCAELDQLSFKVL